jgi:hypothetical protein
LSAFGESLILPRRRPTLPSLLKRAALSPRFYVYVSCTVLAVLVSYHLGKEMLWDTMDYHVYAGFSALHDRFGLDYFAAGPQGYFNPYAYVPFYLLLRSSLTPLEDASILAALQSGILWLTYELAMVAAPTDQPRARLAIAILATVLAFANPVMINQLGSSFVDITTAEIALGGWLVLLTAVRAPSAARVLCGALLLGAASALKPTNAVHAISAAPILLFVPGGWRTKLRDGALFAVGLGTAFALVSASWSIRLEHHFGSPVFPLLNGLFRSPEFTTARMTNYEFIPASLGAALLRPFALAIPRSMVQVEWIAPDLRYAVLVVMIVLLTLTWLRRRVRKSGKGDPSADGAVATRALIALGCGFLLDWTLWLAASGNGRYFMPGACVAAILGMVLIFRVFVGLPSVRNYVLATVFGLQLFQLYAGTEFRAPLPWSDGPWFRLSIPAKLESQPELYFTIGELTNSFVIPYLAAGSGFVNLDGEYVLGAAGANGRHIETLIRRFAPHLRVMMRDPRVDADSEAGPPNPAGIANVLEPFGLKVDASRCSRVAARGVTVPWTNAGGAHPRRVESAAAAHTEYIVTCHVSWSGSARTTPLPGERAADLAFDHMEDACPALFQPPRPVDTFLGDPVRGYVFVRRYPNTDIVAWVGRGWVKFQNPVGGVREENLGRESAWDARPLRVACAREGDLRVLQPVR